MTGKARARAKSSRRSKAGKRPAGMPAPTPHPVETLLAGGNAGYLRAAQRLLKTLPGISIAAVAASAAEAAAQMDRWRPQLALIDVRLPDSSGFELIRRIKAAHPAAKVVLVAAEADAEYRAAATRAGADGLVSREGLARQLPAQLQALFARPRGGRRAARVRADAQGADGRFRSTFNQAAVGILHTTTEGWILEANRALCDLLGYTSTELRTRNTRDLTHPDDRDRQDALRLELLSGLRRTFSSEKRYLRKDGTPVWVNRTVAVGREAPGAEPYLIQTIEDITERKRAEAALQGSQAQYLGLIDSLDSIVWEGDAQTFQFTYVSRQAEKLLGYPVERWINEPTFWQDHMHPDDREWAVDYCVQATREMRPHDFEYRMLAADGRTVWLRDIVNVVVEAGRPVRSRGVMVDITAGKQAELDARRHARARRVLAECTHALVHAADETSLLREMCRIVVESGGYVQTHIGLAMNDARKTVYPAAAAGYEPGYLERKDLRWGGDGAAASMTGRVIASGERYLSRDVYSDPNASHLVERARARGFSSQLGLPLRVGGVCVGAISIYAREQNAFDEEEVALLATLADDISFGLSSLRTRAAQQRMATELSRVARAQRVMAECSHALVHAQSEEQLVGDMCRIIVDSGGYQQGWVGLAGEDPARPVVPVAHAGYVDETPMVYTGISPVSGEPGAALQALRSGNTVVVRDILGQPGNAWRRERALRNGFQSSIALPLTSGRDALGVLVMHAPEPDAFSDEEIALLSTLANDIGYGMAKLRADAARRVTEARLARLTRARSVMAECSQALVHATDERQLLGEMCRIAVESGGFQQAWIAEVIGRDPTRVRAAAHAGYGAGAPMTGASYWAADGRYQGLASEAISEGRARIARDILNNPAESRKRSRALELGYQSSIALPLREQERIVGALVLHAAEKDAFDEEEIALLDELAADLSYGIASLRTDQARREAEQRLRDSERRVRDMFDQAAVGITRSDLNGVLVEVNQKFCEMLGYTREELIGKSNRDITHPDDYGRGARIREDVQRGARITSAAGEKRFLRKDGTVFWARRTMSVAYDDAGQPRHVVAVIEDISGRKELEQQFRDTFEQAAIGILHTDLDGRYLRVNRKLCEISGYSEAELVGGQARLSHPEDVESGGSGRRQLLDGSIASHSNEKRYARKDGKVIWVNRTESLARDASGRPLYFIRMIEDITARKAAEERYRATFESAPMGIMHTAAEGYRILRANPKMCELLGYTQEELQGMTSTDIVHPEYRFTDGPRYRGPMEDGRMAAFSSERKYLRKDGSWIWVNRTVSVVRDAAGRPEYHIRVVEDITERKLAQEAVARERALLRTIIDAMPDRIYVKDSAGRFLLENVTNLRSHGIRNIEDAIGKTVFDLFPAETAARLHAEDQSIVESGRPVINRERAQTGPSGERQWFLTTKVPLKDAEGRVTGIVGVSREITDRKQAEETIASERALLRTVIDSLPDLIYVMDREGRYLLMNEAGLRWRGMASREDVVGRTVHEFFDAEVARGIRAEDEEVMRSGVPILNQERQTLYRGGQESGSDRRWHSTTKVPLRDARGAVAGMVVVNRDITERKRMERALRENVERFEIAARATNDAIWDWDLVANRLWWSEGFESLFGYRRETAGSDVESWTEGIHPADRERVVGGIHRTIDSGGRSWSEEYRFRRADGTYAEIYDRGYVMHDATGRPVRMIGAMMDVTERSLSHRRREMAHEVTRVLAAGTTVAEAMPPLIRAMCDAMGWCYGARWAWSESSQSLERAEHWSDFVPAFSGADEEEPWRRLRMTGTGGLVRRAWHEKQPTWIEDIGQAPSLHRAPAALRFGLRSALTFPIVVGGSAVGIMEFFGREPFRPDDMLLQVSESIGRQIGQFLQRAEAEEARRLSEAQFRQLAENIPQVFWMTDVEQKRLHYVSPAFETISGQSIEQVHANPRGWLDAVHEEDRARVRNARKDAATGGYDESFRVVRPDGSVRWVHDRAFPVHDESGRVYRIAGITEDVTERKQSEAQLMQLAHYDVLTSLPNRVLFYDRLKQTLAQARRNQWNVGVLFIDVDRFKNVNDTLGHAVGDQLLRQVSERLTAAVRTGDTVGRLGGDEFAIVLSDLGSGQDASLVAQKIMAGFSEPFKLEASEVYVTASIGITLFPDDSIDQDTLIRNADAAMYRAKELGRNAYQFYTPEMNARAQALLGMENSLRRALDRDEFLLHYQPKASAATGEITGLEALLRWRHPERGLVSPAEFIPVLEETGLIVPVGEWVVRAACGQVREWQRAGLPVVPVAVNLSARQFQSPRLGATIIAAIEASGIPPSLLEIEITESSLMQNAEQAISTLREIKARGVKVSIDDFGTGYSSLAYLKRFPLDALKIDRSFVRDVDSDLDNATITRAVISMAHSLGLKVIAEGVETEPQLEFLAEYGCDEVQGYLLARPLVATDCEDWLRGGRRLQRPQEVRSTGDSPVVLLVDDDDDALTLLRRTLARDGYQLHTARNAHEALDLLARARVDLVISDQHMPGVQGMDFLQRVARLHPRTVRLMTSGHADAEFVAAALDRQVISRFLPKGMDETRLRSDVREALRARGQAGAGAPDPLL